MYIYFKPILFNFFYLSNHYCVLNVWMNKIRNISQFSRFPHPFYYLFTTHTHRRKAANVPYIGSFVYHCTRIQISFLGLIFFANLLATYIGFSGNQKNNNEKMRQKIASSSAPSFPFSLSLSLSCSVRVIASWWHKRPIIIFPE